MAHRFLSSPVYQVIVLALIVFVSVVSTGRAENASVQSAFLFSDKKDWTNATQHARKSGDPALIKLIKWQYALDQESGALFNEITDFIQNNPNWPQQARLKLRAEQSIRMSAVDNLTLLAWFEKNPPVSGVGKIAYAEALKQSAGADTTTLNTLIKEAWIQGDFDENEEKRILYTYNNIIGAPEHIKRIDRLLWEDRSVAALRILELAPGDERTLFRARIALAADEKNASTLVNAVPKKLQSDAGLIYTRMKWRARKDDNTGVRDMLLAAPINVPFPDKWWRQREYHIRAAIGENNIKLASRLLTNHGQKEGSEYADALWLQGWLKLEFQNEPEQAARHFSDMYEHVKFPVSKARAAYWAARAADKAGSAETANSWYNLAQTYPSTFYGQLAHAKLSGSSPLQFSDEPEPSADAKKRFQASELARVIHLAIANDHDDIATQFLNHVIDTTESADVMAAAARSVRDWHSTHLGVRAAKRAIQQNVLMFDTGYPRPKLPADLDLEPALTLAIARQESEFDTKARSKANALGLMQLLPRTAKEVAKKNDMPYAESKLFEPGYNMTLGSIYLNRLVNGFDGSYIKAIAGYNAGPGRVREWVDEFGQPGNSVESAVNWIETIPFLETRNYVMRVLENLQAYRHLLANGKSQPLQIEEDLLR